MSRPVSSLARRWCCHREVPGECRRFAFLPFEEAPRRKASLGEYERCDSDRAGPSRPDLAPVERAQTLDENDPRGRQQFAAAPAPGEEQPVTSAVEDTPAGWELLPRLRDTCVEGRRVFALQPSQIRIPLRDRIEMGPVP
jgi:hypothetical protein